MFVPEQDDGAAASAAIATAASQTPEKLPVPWPKIVAMFETTSIPKETSALPIISSNCPQQNVGAGQGNGFSSVVGDGWQGGRADEDILKELWGLGDP